MASDGRKRSNRLTPDQAAGLEEMVRSGMRFQEAANAMGGDRTAVEWRLNKVAIRDLLGHLGWDPTMSVPEILQLRGRSPEAKPSISQNALADAVEKVVAELNKATAALTELASALTSAK